MKRKAHKRWRAPTMAERRQELATRKAEHHAKQIARQNRIDEAKMKEMTPIEAAQYRQRKAERLRHRADQAREEYARSIARLIELEGYTETELAKELNTTRGSIARAVKTAKMYPPDHT